MIRETLRGGGGGGKEKRILRGTQDGLPWSQCSERENLSLVQLQGSFSSTKVRITLTIILNIWIDESRDGSEKKKKKNWKYE